MGFFSDLGKAFDLKAYMKIQMDEMSKENVIEVYEKCITKAKSMDFSTGSLENILEDIKAEFKKFIVWNDDISNKEEEELLGKLYRL